MARHTEPLVNAVLAGALDRRFPRWRVTAEQTDVGHGGHSLRWPNHGWLRGGIDDLARVIEEVSLSERLVAEVTRN